MDELFSYIDLFKDDKLTRLQVYKVLSIERVETSRSLTFQFSIDPNPTN